jgi:hypothetical protein
VLTKQPNGSTGHEPSKLVGVYGRFKVLIDVAAYKEVVNATQGDIDRSTLDQVPVLGVDDRLDHFTLKVAYLAGVAAKGEH